MLIPVIIISLISGVYLLKQSGEPKLSSIKYIKNTIIDEEIKTTGLLTEPISDTLNIKEVK